MLAVIKTGGKQYIVSPGKKIKIEKLDIEEGKEVAFEEVLLINDGKETTIGEPVIKGATVLGKILKQDKDKKIIIFKYKAKKRYKVKNGHRQPFTEVEISEIKTK
jgi:large subunit ribosomal protein L21